MTRSRPLVVPVLKEYEGVWRDWNGRLLKSYSGLELKLDEELVGLWDKDRLGVVMLAMLVVLQLE
jgi:hypothetical protein